MVCRQLLDATVVGSESDGFALQRRLTELSRGPLVAALEQALTRAVPDDDHWVFDRLEIDVGTLAIDNFEDDFVDAVTTALERSVRQAVATAGTSHRTGRAMDGPRAEAGAAKRSRPDNADHDGSTPRRLTGKQSVQQALLHFLRTGTLPWWFDLAPGVKLEDAVTASWFDDVAEAGGGEWAELVSLLALSTNARIRLVRQFPAPVRERLLRRLSPPMVDVVAGVIARVVDQVRLGLAQRLQERLWQAAFLLAAGGRPATADNLHDEWGRAAATEDNAVRDAIAEIGATWLEVVRQPVSTAADTTAVPVRRTTSVTGETLGGSLDLDEGLFVEDAGLVLLHPFLPALFERLDIAAAGVLLQLDRALALLHFLATGTTPAPEYRLLVPKLLCGLPLDEPAPAPVTLTEAEIEEAAALLTAVIGHWVALADTSPDALRGTFLTRPGKLSMRGGDWLLQVEQQSFDVLLDRLPWGVGAIRLPWMTRLLWVEWRM